MAIKWYDFSASSNGTGTYADPYNGSTSTGYLVTGDEGRIKSHSMADLTDFTFTGSYEITATTSNSPYIDVPDASLFTVGDICMADADKTCFRISSIDTSANKIKMHNNFERWPASMAWSVTNATFRRIKPEYYSGTGTNFYVKGSSITSPILVSDGWSSETTRVTDQSYITLAGASQTATSLTQLQVNYLGEGSTVNFENTCLVACKDSQGARFGVEYGEDNLTVNLHQLWGGLYYGLWLYGVNGINITVKYVSTYYGPTGSGGTYGNNHIMHFKNYRPYQTYYDNRSGGDNITFIVGNMSARSLSGSIWDYSYKDLNFIYDGAWQSGSGGMPSTWQFAGTAEFTSNFTISYDNYAQYNNVGGTAFSPLPKILDVPYVNKVNGVFTESGVINNSSTSITTEMYVAPMTEVGKNFADRSKVRVKVQDFYFIWDPAKVTFNGSYTPRGAASYFKNISTGEEYEALGSNNTDVLSYGMRITKDTAVYKTTSPSLKCNQPAYHSSYSGHTYVKALDVPVNGDGVTAFTITGWLKADAGMFVAGQLNARVVYDDITTITETIDITAVEAGWVQFSIEFVPKDKQLAQFQLRMYPQSGSKSVWLSDLGVS